MPKDQHEQRRRAAEKKIGRAAATREFTGRNTSIPDDPVSRQPDAAQQNDPSQSAPAAPDPTSQD